MMKPKHKASTSMTQAFLTLLLALPLAWLSPPVWAQSTGSKSNNSKPSMAEQVRASLDVTGNLQARAIAEAAAGRPQTTESAPSTDLSTPPQRPVQSLLAAQPDPTAMLPVTAQEGLGRDELAIAERIHQGVLPCELGASVRVEADGAQPGYFHVLGKGFRYRMHPVRTNTGALRLEDPKAGAVWLQLANKSMLMDQKRGRRLVDQCAHPEQIAFAERMKTNPPPRLIDVSGMGR